MANVLGYIILSGFALLVLGALLPSRWSGILGYVALGYAALGIWFLIQLALGV